MRREPQPDAIAIIGAGPAGLTAGYKLARRGYPVRLFEADPVYVGGISKTVKYKGFHFDIGGHRFFSKSREIEDLWTEILPDDLLTRPRSSRIYYKRQLFSYPLKGFETLFKLGPAEGCRCVWSYLQARLAPVPHPDNFEDWVCNHFGRRLFNIFFKSYTEKVWGIGCREISADWASQRIKGLSLGQAIRQALLPRAAAPARASQIKTLIHSFRYPRLGPGMLWEACANKIRECSGTIHLGHTVRGLSYAAPRGEWTVRFVGPDGAAGECVARHVISSAPLRELALSLEPPVSPAAAQAAAQLHYRDFILVALVVKDRRLFADNWIYIHDPSVKVGRIQNFKSWSPEMVPDPDRCCYGLEYFCFEGDDLWTAPDAELIRLAEKELVGLGLARAGDVTDGHVVRQPKAYPVYHNDYDRHVRTLREELRRRYPNLHLVGRNGMHKYNNQDHAMMTALLCVENIAAGGEKYDLWAVNQDAQYIESGA